MAPAPRLARARLVCIMIGIVRTPKQRAKLFWTGRSQAVRLPKEFRFEGESVAIRREGQRVILEPDDAWPQEFVDWLKAGPHLPADFEIPRSRRLTRRKGWP